MKLEKNKVKKEKEENGGIMEIKQSYVMNVLVMDGSREDLGHLPKCPLDHPKNNNLCYDKRSLKRNP